MALIYGNVCAHSVESHCEQSVARVLFFNNPHTEGTKNTTDYVAHKYTAKYVTNILTKDRTSQLKFAGNQYNRKQILDHKYSCNLNGLKKDATYLIIDDVTTTGTTFDEISRTINEASNNQTKLYSFALVQTLWNRDYTSDKQSYNQKFYQQLIA